ncbi:alpha-amylase family protein [Chitinophaga rhizophila]|uniref:Alpha-amylase family protein n=1 Tax=Chitinophaga rhizophila TaxID=2866212 RepID=A0ABS7GJ33_9BACT|nr:alpha-amylase family protein [Chitinophaga rhizophila]MBW8686789.1 alpha-amylase family protein [Chitinophaga rhizophila]
MKHYYYLFTCLLSLHISFSYAQHPLRNPAEDRWYKKAIIYSLEVHTFKDSDGDGKGDFQGLTQQLDYLKGLGIDAIWLAPFHPSPRKDDGYDVADYYGIDSSCGTKGDFTEFMYQAKLRGIRVMMDMVLNHTSDQHPWFQQARKNTNSAYYKWYAWSKERPSNYNKGMAFPGVQKEVWTYDSLAHAWYFHRFYKFQPDLNFTNPHVRAESERIISYWLQQGIAGFRLDAVPFMLEVATPGQDEPPQQYEIIPDMQRFAQWRNGEAIMLGEANVPPKDNKKYYGENGEGLQMMFNFYVNQYLFYAFATGKLSPFVKALEDTRAKPASFQWAYFLRNHDEIDLGRLSKEQRNEVYKAFGPDTSMQLYDRGIRRRLAPMLGNNQRRLKMAYSMLFALPGTPVMRYGDEIGMGDNLQLNERLAVRTPMQWSAAPQAGFTTAAKAFRPVIDSGEYGYKHLNVAAQQQSRESMLHFMKDMISLRRACPEIALGEWQTDILNGSVLRLHYQYKGKSLTILHNFADKPQQVQLSGAQGQEILQELSGSRRSISPGKGGYTVSLEGYGYAWFRHSDAPGK